MRSTTGISPASNKHIGSWEGSPHGTALAAGRAETSEEGASHCQQSAHPARTATRSVTPKPVKHLERAAHPVSLAKFKIEDVAVNALRGRPRHKQSRHNAQPSVKAPAAPKGNRDEQATPARTRGGAISASVPDGIEVALLGGNDDLDVVGESYYCYRPCYLNIQRLNYLWTIRHSSARIAGNLVT
jgi:hypothetical protein